MRLPWQERTRRCSSSRLRFSGTMFDFSFLKNQFFHFFLLLKRKSAQENEEKNSQLSSHVGVLEDLLEQKKEHLDYIEARLEAMGLDPVTVTAFEIDSTIEREIYLKEQAQSFDERLKQLKQSVNRRNELVADTLKALQVISETLEELEKQQ